MKRGFYKYISKRKDKYIIRYNGESYGEYDDVTDALYDRDLYIACDWDMTEALARDESDNPYKSMNLPEYGYDKYIHEKKSGNKIYYSVRKVIDGVQIFFGQYRTFDEAMKRRDELRVNGWVK